MIDGLAVVVVVVLVHVGHRGAVDVVAAPVAGVVMSGGHPGTGGGHQHAAEKGGGLKERELCRVKLSSISNYIIEIYIRLESMGPTCLSLGEMQGFCLHLICHNLTVNLDLYKLVGRLLREEYFGHKVDR